MFKILMFSDVFIYFYLSWSSTDMYLCSSLYAVFSTRLFLPEYNEEEITPSYPLNIKLPKYFPLEMSVYIVAASYKSSCISDISTLWTHARKLQKFGIHWIHYFHRVEVQWDRGAQWDRGFQWDRGIIILLK